MDTFIVSLEICYREIVIMDSLDQLSGMWRRCLEYTRNILSTLRLLVEEGNAVRSFVYTLPSEGPG